MKGYYHHKNLRQKLLNSLKDEIKEYGPALISLRRIAQRAGVSHAAPYRHFQGKDDLLAAAVWEGQARFTDCLKNARESGSAIPQERLFRLGGAYLVFSKNNPELLELMFSETGMRAMQLYPPEDGDTNQARYDSFAVLETTVRECQAAGVLDPEQESGALALFIWSFIHGYAIIRKEGFAASMGASRGFSGEDTDRLVMKVFRSLTLSTR